MPAFVQEKDGSLSPGATLVLNFNSDNIAGNLLVLVIEGGGGDILSIKDSRGNVYHDAVDLGTGNGLSLWYAYNIAGGTNAVTIHFSSSNFWAVQVCEYSGIVSTSDPLDQVATGTGTGTSYNSGSKTLATRNELIIGATACTGDGCLAATGGFTIRANFNFGQQILQDFTNGALGSNAVAGTCNSGNWGSLMATFLPTSQTFYLVDQPATFSAHGSLQNGGTGPSVATTTTAWTTPLVASRYARQSYASTVASGTFAAGVQPSGVPNTSDCWRSECALTGSYANAAWIFALALLPSGSVTATATVNARIRVWHSPDPTGQTSITEITSSTAALSNAVWAASAVQRNTTVTATLLAATLVGEYLFIQIALEQDSTGAATVQIVQDPNNSVITTANWTPSTTLAHVQSNAADYPSLVGGATLAFEGENTVGNTIVVVGVGDALTTISDVSVNSYGLWISDASGGTGSIVTVWVAQNIAQAAPGANGVTVIASGGLLFGLFIAEFNALSNAAILTNYSNNASGTAATTGSIATIGLPTAMLAAFNWNGTTPTASGLTAGFVEVASESFTQLGGLLGAVQSGATAGSYSAAITLSTPTQWTGAIVAFQAVPPPVVATGTPPDADIMSSAAW
jgi:hypothetical protein